MSPRDLRYSRTVGVRPFSGHRYVQDGLVRIEWTAAGRRCTRTIGPNTATNRDTADQILDAALREARDRAEGRSHAADDLTLAALLLRYEEDAKYRRNPRTGQGLRPRTLVLYAEQRGAILRHLDPTLPAERVRRHQVRTMIRAMRQRELAEGTVSRLVDHLKSAYKWAVEEELIDVNSVAGVRTPGRIAANPEYSPEERDKLAAGVLALPTRAWRFRGCALLYLVYGIRSQQAFHLAWRDVDLDSDYLLPVPGQRVRLVGSITFRRDAPGSKGQADRTLPLLPIVREALGTALRYRRDETPWVFWHRRNAQKPVRYDSMLQELHKLEARVGVVTVRGRGFHAFRRALATALVEGTGIAQASRWVGDRPDVLLRRYVKPTEEAAAQAALWVLNHGAATATELQLAAELTNGPPVKRAVAGGSNMGGTGLEPVTSGM